MSATMYTQQDEANDYLEQVRAHLHDLDADELEDLLEDLILHLDEVRAEGDGPLEAILGPPADFAADLRTSAGFDSVEPARWLDSRLKRAKALKARMDQHEWVNSVTAFLPELRPAWWTARGYFLIKLLSGFEAPFFPPRLFDSAIIGTVAAAAAIVASVRFGRARYPSGLRRTLGLGLSALAVVAGVLMVANSSSGAVATDYYPYAEPYIDQTILPANIYAYSPDGTPLGPVLLFNETGQPIDLPIGGYSEWADQEFTTSYELDATGRPIVNLYPREMSYYDFSDGYERLVPAPVPLIPELAALPATAGPLASQTSEPPPVTTFAPAETVPRAADPEESTPPTTVAAPGADIGVVPDDAGS